MGDVRSSVTSQAHSIGLGRILPCIAARTPPPQRTAPTTFIPLALVVLGARGGDSQDSADGVGRTGGVGADGGHLGHRPRGGCKAKPSGQHNTSTSLPKSHCPPQTPGMTKGGRGALLATMAPPAREGPPTSPAQPGGMPQHPRADAGAETQSPLVPISEVDGAGGEQTHAEGKPSTRRVRSEVPGQAAWPCIASPSPG